MLAEYQDGYRAAGLDVDGELFIVQVMPGRGAWHVYCVFLDLECLNHDVFDTEAEALEWGREIVANALVDAWIPDAAVIDAMCQMRAFREVIH